jgi:hypothetical protein
MLRVALSVDRNGSLNYYSMDPSVSSSWQGPITIGSPCLIPGSRVTAFQFGETQFFAFVVDSNGVFNAASLDTTDENGWQGPDTVGNADFLPATPIAVFQQSDAVITALLVDRSGVLNAMSLTVGATQEWQGPLTIGGACLAPGTPVSVVSISETSFSALMVDQDGVLNTAFLDVSAGNGWDGPDTVGNAYLLPESLVSVA